MRWLAIGVLVVGCGTEARGGGGGSSSTGTGVGADGESTLKTWGEVCTADADCATGRCLDNELAGFGWCSAECDEVKEPCPADSLGNIGGWCVEMPEDFPDEPRRFCVPVCNDIFECQAKTDLWEECQQPEWKGNVLYGDASDVRACQSPSAHGKIKIDTTTCADWKDAFAGFAKQIATCEAYCEYLVTCKEVPSPSTYNKTCCAYGCTLQAVKDGEIQEPYEKEKQCYEQAHFSFRGTPQLCSAPLDQCGKNPEDPTPQ